jgi:peptide subunit release factor 1 (eRF1)
MKNINKEIKKLAKLSSSNAPFLSFYINTKWESDQQKERVRIFFNRKSNEFRRTVTEESKKESLEADLAKIKDYLDGLLHSAYDTEYSGIAIFACNELDFYSTLKSHFTFDDKFTISTHPQVRQLVRISDEFKTALLVMVSSKSARIFEISMGGEIQEFDIETEIPGRVTSTSWADIRYQRHIEELRDRHLKEVIDHLGKIVKKDKIDTIILNGQNHLLNRFQGMLPNPLKEKVIDTLHLDINSNQDKIMEKTVESLQKFERKEEKEIVKSTIDSALAGGLAITGVEDTLKALNRRQVHRLLIDKDFSDEGWRCMDCSSLGKSEVKTCPFCDGEVQEVMLGEEMVQLAILQEADVESVLDNDDLKNVGEVAASLRFK